jgi:putative ABC transport system permease protein
MTSLIAINPLNRKLLRSLWNIRAQALAIVAVVACGVAVYVMTFGTLRSLNETMAAYYERNRFAEVFATVKRAPESLLPQLRAVAGVKAVQTRIVKDVTLDIEGFPEPAIGRLISLPRYGTSVLNDIVLRRGRLPDHRRPDEAVLAEALASAHALGPGSRVTATINGKKRRLEIVGVALSPEYVYSIGPGVLVPDDKRFGVLWMGRDALAAAYDLDAAFNDISLSLLRSSNPNAVIMRLDPLLEAYGGTGAYGREDQVSHAFLSNELKGLDIIGEIIPPIFLAVAAFLLHIVVNRLIQTEREQIGLLKAFGYSNATVAGHYLMFVLTIACVGTVVGLVAGTWLGRLMTELYAQFFRFPLLHFHFAPSVYVWATVVSVGAAGAGALSAVLKAARLAPATAMQPPAPTDYRRGALVLLGPVLRLSQPSRMILRHLVRWPLRASMTLTGMAAAGGLLVAMLFFYDSIEHLLESYFHQGHRQDATISFVEASPGTALQEIRRLPGVLVAEGFRAVPVTLRNGHLQERTALNGVERNGDLERLLDLDQMPMHVPDRGLLLSKQMASQLQVGLGDSIRVDVREGRRPRFDLPVSAVVEEFVGAPVYISRANLNRLMSEGDVISGAHVLVDGAVADRLYQQLKDTPRVAGITLQTASLQTFRETMAETLDIMISFYVAFGGLIAFGVVYNSARLALSERSRELASLRVLGFTTGEIAYILFGELILLSLASLPLACVFGYGLAWTMAVSFDSELFRLPFVIDPDTYGIAVSMIGGATLVSALLVWRRILNLDLVAALKTRE